MGIGLESLNAKDDYKTDTKQKKSQLLVFLPVFSGMSISKANGKNRF
jgi:hypothetical protein